MEKKLYCKVCMKLKDKCTCPKQEETKEQTMSDSSGAFEAPIFGKTILKRDIHKIPNFVTKKSDVKEQMDSSVSAGAQYDAPIGTAGPSSPMDHKKKKRKDPLALDEKDEVTRTASITAASTPDMISTKKGFPKFGGPGAKFVEINSKCKKFPYCNQGADSDGAWKHVTNIKLKEAIQEASKKYGISIAEVTKIVSEALPSGMLDDPGNKKAMKSWTEKEPTIMYHITTPEPLEIKTDDEIEVAKLKMLFYKHDVRFHVHQFKK